MGPFELFRKRRHWMGGDFGGCGDSWRPYGAQVFHLFAPDTGFEPRPFSVNS
jgi:hypothetical protein